MLWKTLSRVKTPWMLLRRPIGYKCTIETVRNRPLKRPKSTENILWFSWRLKKHTRITLLLSIIKITLYYYNGDVMVPSIGCWKCYGVVTWCWATSVPLSIVNAVLMPVPVSVVLQISCQTCSDACSYSLFYRQRLSNWHQVQSTGAYLHRNGTEKNANHRSVQSKRSIYVRRLSKCWRLLSDLACDVLYCFRKIPNTDLQLVAQVFNTEQTDFDHYKS